MSGKFIFGMITLALLWFFSNWSNAQSALDTVYFGNAVSETGHSLANAGAQGSMVVNGSLGQTARECLPNSYPGTTANTDANINGGGITVSMAVDPSARNYFTVKLWGADDSNQAQGRIYLYVPLSQFPGISFGTAPATVSSEPPTTAPVSMQVGYRHEGDYLASLSEAGYKQSLPGRFEYVTILLPTALTVGRTSLTVTIQAVGRIYTLGTGDPSNGGNYQYSMQIPSRPIYAAYTHTQPYLDVSGELQGALPTGVAIQPTTGQASVATMQGPNGNWFKGVAAVINSLLTTTPTTTANTLYLARSYSVSGVPGSTSLPGYQNPAVVTQTIAAIDAFATGYYASPNYTGSAVSAGGNEGWGGRFGNLGWAIHLLMNVPAFQSALGATATYGAGGTMTRSVAWSTMLLASRDFGRFIDRDNHEISNQNLLANTSIYQANRGVLDMAAAGATVASGALTETQAQRYILESDGLQPWLGCDLPSGGSTHPFGTNYFAITPKGLSREWGFVGADYGEVQYMVADHYKFTGNPVFLQQATKMGQARAAFRRPAVEVSGGNFYQSMEEIGMLAWRGANESDGNGWGDQPAYADASFSSVGMHTAAVTGDPMLIGYAKQHLADNMYFSELNDTQSSTRYNIPVVLEAVGDYPAVAAATDPGTRLPMTTGQPNFVWADEEEGIAALMQGTDRLWVEPYYQAKTGSGVNRIARFHYMAPDHDQVGLLETTPQLISGGTFSRNDIMDKPELNFYVPPDDPAQAYTGERIDLGPSPADAADDQPWRGKALFYAFRFKNYTFGMNRSTSTYQLISPQPSGAQDLVSGRTMTGTQVSVPANSTVVLYTPDSAGSSCLTPNAAQGLAFTATSNTVTLTWNALPAAASYTILRGATPTGPFRSAGAASVNTYTGAYSSGLPYYAVIAANSCGTGYSSAVIGPVSNTSIISAGPNPWLQAEVGTPKSAFGYVPGTATFVNGTATITAGTNTDIGSAADSFHYVYTTLTEDSAGQTSATLTAKLDTLNTLKAGLMVRTSLASNAPMAAELIEYDDEDVRFPYRATAGSFATYPANPDGGYLAPIWLRVVIQGASIISYTSYDGINYTQQYSATVNLPATSTIYLGLAASNDDSSFTLNPETSTFTNVTLSVDNP